MELKRIVQNEEDAKKKKFFALKVTNFKDIDAEDKECQSESNEDMDLLFLTR